MQIKSEERLLSALLYVGTPFISVFLLLNQVTDPVNATKLVALGVVAVSALGMSLITHRGMAIKASPKFVFALIAFLIFGLISTITGSAPFSQNFYGEFGRNTGFLTLAFLIAVAFSAASLREVSNFKKLLIGLMVAGVINSAYSFWVVAFGDFLPWNNPYGNFLGTFGNPNFVSSFLGMFLTVMAGFMLAEQMNWPKRLAYMFGIAMTFFLIVKSNSIQGIAVAGIGVSISVFFFIRSRFAGVFVWIYSGFIGVLGVFATLGVLQKGPLAQYIYKTSVSLRGEYWAAGINAGSANPLTGIGLDSYGDWFRRSRRESAIVLPGPDTVSNAAHNVIIDYFASGGWPLLISYIAILLLTLLSIIRVLRRTKKYDQVFVGLFATWICFMTQAIISINQIGLAVWGWVLTGALIGYEVATRPKISETLAVSQEKGRKVKIKKKRESNGAIPVALAGGLIGLVLALPPLQADMTWRNAMKSGDALQVEAALEVDYMHPPSATRLANAYTLFESNGLGDLAYKWVKTAIDFSPDHFDFWKMLYYASKSTENDKRFALENMKRLDPLNPDVLKL
jgi:O-antigen ligase